MKFTYSMRAAVSSRRSNITNWGNAILVKIVAESKQEAIAIADTALGEAGTEAYWVFDVQGVETADV